MSRLALARGGSSARPDGPAHDGAAAQRARGFELNRGLALLMRAAHLPRDWGHE